VLVAMSFFALGYPLTCIIGLVMSGLKAMNDDKKIVGVSTTIVDGLVFGPANLLFFGVTVVLQMVCYTYIRYALRLQLKEIPTVFPWLYFLSYSGLGLLFIFPPIKVHLSPYDYGIQCIGFEIFMIFSIAWMAYFSQWMKGTGGRVIFVVALVLASILLVLSWGLAAALGEESSAPVEWSSLGIVMGCYAIVVFMCEREKVLKLNSSGFSNQVSATPQEYEQL